MRAQREFTSNSILSVHFSLILEEEKKKNRSKCASPFIRQVQLEAALICDITQAGDLVNRVPSFLVFLSRRVPAITLSPRKRGNLQGISVFLDYVFPFHFRFISAFSNVGEGHCQIPGFSATKLQTILENYNMHEGKVTSIVNLCVSVIFKVQ